jgi:hypothetical protein
MTDMDIKAGLKLVCPACTTEVVVVRPPSSAVALTCSGEALVAATDPRPAGGHAEGTGDGTLVGKRYSDEGSGLELLCAKAGPGALEADGRTLPVKGAKPLPSSD